ncbi:hypothetical protein HII31_01941 [Pseudocercospora fuligena]|uniref:Uncharacterized protein n=1 Tax=Pseudocercospora fuligena TaxID=685502 RepID=A0A8H6RSZ1_9PEZI|nr:hypothetical protein HII31_01941 [Pseudocercospora fuligena]
MELPSATQTSLSPLSLPTTLIFSQRPFFRSRLLPCTFRSPILATLVHTMPTGPCDHLEHDFAFNDISEARADTSSCYTLSPIDDDYHQLCGEENQKALVYDIYHAIIAHAKRETSNDARNPAPSDVDPEAWVEFQIDQEENLRRILKKEENWEREVERRCWVMLDQIFSIHQTGARSSNFFGPAEKWMLKLSQRLERVVKAVESADFAGSPDHRRRCDERT